MLNFCTLFDSNYLSRGLAMYESLVENCNDFHLYIFAFDEISYTVLKKLELPHTSIISLPEFENEELLRVKPGRSRAEYCWTCTPSTILFCIEKYKLDHCTYIDADLYFYSNPEILLNEIGDKSVLITEHRYIPKYDQSLTSGKYCVQFMTFKNTSEGLNVLTWWKNACITWCYNRLENGKFGDQKYLDDWTTRFNCVHVLQNEGGGLAPWNIEQYQITSNFKYICKKNKTTEKVKPVFYHFQSLSFYSKNLIELAADFYAISAKIKKCIYFPYIRHINKINNRLRMEYNVIDFNGTIQTCYTIYFLRDKLYLYRKAFFSLNIKKIKETIKLIKEQHQLPIKNFIQGGSVN